MGFFRLQGDKRLAAKLKTLDKKVANKISRQSLRAGARVIQPAVKKQISGNTAPATRDKSGPFRKAGPKRTGKLAKAVKVRAAKRKRGVVGVNVQIGKGDFKGETFYGGFVEYDHRTGKRGSKGRRLVKGQRHMKKGFEASKAQAVAVARAELERGIAEASR